jgi:hypothetical protein
MGVVLGTSGRGRARVTITKIIPFFDDVEIETEYDWCKHRAEKQKNVASQTRTLSVQQPGTPSKKATLAKSHLSTVDTLILLLLQFTASSMRRTVPKIAVILAIPIESNYSRLCWLNLFCAELRENDRV